MSGRIRRTAGCALLGALVTLALLTFATADAHAGVLVGAAPNIPTPNGAVTVGQSGVAASLSIQNSSTDSQSTLNVTLSAITLVPSCGTVASVDCPAASFDPGVFQLAATASGRAGSGCAGASFSIAIVDAGQGKVQLTPQTPVVLGPANAGGAAATCIIDFTVSVLKVPAVDARPDLPGVQTNELAGATGTASDAQTGQGTGSNDTTIDQATPTIATNASGPIALGAGTLTDNATVSGRANPLAGATVTFSLYGPNDATCSGAVMTTSTVPYPVAGGTVTSFAFTPQVAGSYRWIASYSGDANNASVTSPCNAANESTPVTKASPTISSTASPGVVVGSGSLVDNATVSGRSNPFTGATVTFSLYGPDDANCAGPVTFSSTVTYPVAGGGAISAAFTPTAAGTYRWRASYGGDANNAPVASPCNAANEATVVNKAAPTIATTASGPIALGAGTLTDNATVSGRANPLGGATITFHLYGPNDANCSGAVVATSTVPYPVAGGAVSPTPFTPSQAGTYRWIATYSGDGNNSPVTGSCNDANESVIVTNAAPAIATTASADIALGAGTLTDGATVSGRVSPVAGAVVTFDLYGPGDATCAGAVTSTSTVPYPVAGGAVTSAAFTPAQAGTYRWRATYGGDSNNASVAGACNDAGETVVVARATPTITAAASSGVALGAGALSDSATIAGRVSAVAGATVGFRLYAAGDSGCAAAPVFTSTVALGAAGRASSAAFTPTVAGTYRWIATYGGDANNGSVASACADSNQSVTVTPAFITPLPPPLPPTPPVILSAGFGGVLVRVGHTVLLRVNARDKGVPVVGLKVQFGEPGALAGSSACQLQKLTGSASPVALHLPYAFRRPGRHMVKISVLAGSCSGPLATSTPKTIRVTVRPGAAKPKPPTTTRNGCADATLTPTTATRIRVEAAVFCLVNVQRRKYGRAKLVRSKLLARAAASHSADMVRRRYWDHNTKGGLTFEARLPKLGYRGVTRAENMDYFTYETAASAVSDWMASPPHRSNVLNRKLRFAGVGAAIGIPAYPRLPGATITMDFGSTLR